MKKTNFICLLLFIISFNSVYAQHKSRTASKSMSKTVHTGLKFSVKQYKYMLNHLPDSVLPRTTKPDGSLMVSNTRWWTSGFYPGTLWYLYEYSGDKAIKNEAFKRTNLLESMQFNTETHDLGFMMFCSYGNAYRLTNNPAYKTILINSASSLASRYNEKVKAIRSWDHGKWQFPVIIDNMMNLELLTWATKESENPRFNEIANIHAKTTIKNHFREDYSSYHVIDYDTLTGKAIAKKTYQGYSDESAWSRGQAWAMYGYTMMYRETKNKEYLDQAVHIADFMLNHPNMPEDKVPYWDYNEPRIPDTFRDASAGAVLASGLLELSNFVKDSKSDVYWSAAETILTSLTSPFYLAKKGENNGFILKRSVGSLPHGSEVQVPLTYADYYYVEALMRYKKLTGI